MSVARVFRTLAVTAAACLLAATTYGASAARPSTHASHPVRAAHHSNGFAVPVVHRYRPDGMRMGLHCDTQDMSTP